MSTTDHLPELPEPGPNPWMVNAWNAHEVRAFGQRCYEAGVAAERERCAAVCEQVARDDCTCQGDLPDLKMFAAAIRNG
jgi:hypothetical protein